MPTEQYRYGAKRQKTVDNRLKFVYNTNKGYKAEQTRFVKSGQREGSTG